jgi:hypothetical protein
LKLYDEIYYMSVIISTSVDIEMCCPKGKCGCQYFTLLTLKENHGHRGPGNTLTPHGSAWLLRSIVYKYICIEKQIRC